MLLPPKKRLKKEFPALQEHGCPAAISKNGCVTCNRSYISLRYWYSDSVCSTLWPTDVFSFAITAALQKVSHQSGLTVEQCTEEATWFRKIGNKNLVISIRNGMLTMPSFEILPHLHCLCCVCVSPYFSLELSSAVRDLPRQNEGLLHAVLPGKCS